MMKVTLSKYENSKGEIQFVVLQGCNQCIAATKDEKFATEYAKGLYHNHSGKAEFTFWDGIKGEETLLESKVS